MATKVLIVEDEKILALNMENELTDKGYSVTGREDNAADVFASIKRNCPDIVLMDIRLHGKNDGILIAKGIREQYSIPVIYITQLDDEKIFKKAKETFPQNYINKPYHRGVLHRAIELALQNLTTSDSASFDTIKSVIDDTVFIQTETNGTNIYEKRLLTDILCIQSAGSFSYIYFEDSHTEEGVSYYISHPSNWVVRKLVYDALVKVHKSYTINIDRVEKIEGVSIFIKGKKSPIIIGREYKNNFWNKLKLLRHNSGQR